jgi:hypothetical protein
MKHQFTASDFDDHMDRCSDCRHDPLNPCQEGRRTLHDSVREGRASPFDRRLHNSFDDSEE